MIFAIIIKIFQLLAIIKCIFTKHIYLSKNCNRENELDIFPTFAGIASDAKLLQYEKAQAPIDETLSGISIDFKLVK